MNSLTARHLKEGTAVTGPSTFRNPIEQKTAESVADLLQNAKKVRPRVTSETRLANVALQECTKAWIASLEPLVRATYLAQSFCWGSVADALWQVPGEEVKALVYEAERYRFKDRSSSVLAASYRELSNKILTLSGLASLPVFNPEEWEFVDGVARRMEEEI